MTLLYLQSVISWHPLFFALQFSFHLLRFWGQNFAPSASVQNKFQKLGVRQYNPAKNGNVIFIEKHKNPDAIIQGKFIDFKQAKGTDGSVTKQLGRGLMQAEGVVITVMDGTTIDITVQWLNGKINSLKKSYNGFVVIIEDSQGNYRTYTINAKRLSATENLFTAARRTLPSNQESKTLKLI